MSTVTAVPIAPVKRGYLVWLWIGVAAAVLGAAALAWAAPVDPVAGFLARNARQPGVHETASGLEYKVLQPGHGDRRPSDADIALITYTGTLLDGTVFDQSQQPTPLPVVAADPASGRNGVVPGFSEALKLMTPGAKYRFWIKPSLAYGDKAAGPIPAHSVLVFDVNLLDFKSEAEIRQFQMMQQMMQRQGAGAPGASAPGAAPPPGQ